MSQIRTGLGQTGVLSFGDADIYRFYKFQYLTSPNIPTSGDSVNMNRMRRQLALFTVTNDDSSGINAISRMGTNYRSGATTFTVIINSGVILGAPNTSTPAINIEGFQPTDDAVIINNGIISGAGGKGGDPGNLATANPTLGAIGGTAIKIRGPSGWKGTIDNVGEIYGGGGGGGGGEGYFTLTNNNKVRNNFYGAAGGGGAGFVVGQGGAGLGNAAGGQDGTRTTGGGAQSSVGGSSGKGGNIGVAGGSGAVAGGQPGYYLDGSAYITFINHAGTKGGQIRSG